MITNDIVVEDFLLPIEERYYGKSRDLLELEKLIGQWRSKYKTTDPYKIANTYVNKMGADPLVKPIMEKFKSIFGFHTLSLLIIPSPIPNAFTIPLKCRLPETDKDPKLDITYTKNGPKFKPETRMSSVIMVHTGLIANAHFTDDEVLAIILHEVGHTFQHYIINNGSSIDTIGTAFQVLGSFADIAIGIGTDDDSVIYMGYSALLTALFMFNIQAKDGYIGMIENKIQSNPKKYNELGIYTAQDYLDYNKKCADNFLVMMDKNPTVRNVYNAIGKTLTLVTRLAGRFLRPFILIKSIKDRGKKFLKDCVDDIVYKLKNIKFFRASSILPNMRYDDEKIADSFASDLGYGNALMSALNKLYTKDLNIYNDKLPPVLKQLSDIADIPFTIVQYAMDEHPLNGARFISMYEDLCKDLEKGYFDPKQKAEITADIKEMKKNIDKFKSVENLVCDRDHEASFAYKLMLKVSLEAKGGLKYNLSKILPTGFASNSDINTAKELEYQNALRHGDVE